ARAMASWSSIPILSGFRYHAPERRVTAMPLISQNKFRCFWSAGTGWGIFEHRVSEPEREFRLVAHEGALFCRSIDLAWERTSKAPWQVRLGADSIPHRLKDTKVGVSVELSKEIRISPEEPLKVVCGALGKSVQSGGTGT